MLLENLQVKPGDLPDMEKVPFHRHPPRYKWLRLIQLLIFVVAFSMTWWIPLLTGTPDWIWQGILAVWFIAAVLLIVEEWLGFKIRGYALREYDISYKKGFFRFSMVTVPFNRIQHSEISQGPVARMMKLSTLKIYTAGGSSSDLKLGGVDPEEARKLRDFISKETSKYE